MPRKRQNTSLLIKPSSTAPATLSSARAGPSQDGEQTSSVNDLLTQLRVSQRTNENVVPQPSTTSSVHPSLRDILDMPDTAPPRPRPGVRTPINGPTRVRRIPGPPPPKSWLAHSTHATLSAATDERWQRLQHQSIRLPDAYMVGDNSLQHIVLKKMCLEWNWHAASNQPYFTELPTRLRETLLSYIAIFRAGDAASLVNPLRVLFPLAGTMVSVEQDDLDEVRRLDLTNALGGWLSMKGLRRSLLMADSSNGQTAPTEGSGLNIDIPDSWEEENETQLDHDVEEKELENGDLNPGRISFADRLDPHKGDSEHLTLMNSVATYRERHASKARPQVLAISVQAANARGLMKSLTTPRFPNLRHLSLALDPAITPLAVSWATLVSVAAHLPTLESLSLAHWPLPTYTPQAASTYATITSKTSGSRERVAYGGTNMYSALDNDWRESSGILKSLSRSLYCLKWLDLTGCVPWLPALVWEGADSPASSHDGFDMGSAAQPPPNIWNGPWRGIVWLGIGVGWVPSDSASGMALQHNVLCENAERIARKIQQKRLSGKGQIIHFDYADRSGI